MGNSFKEILERKKQTEQLVGHLRDQLIVLNEEIAKENDIRKADVARLKKSLDDKMLALSGRRIKTNGEKI